MTVSHLRDKFHVVTMISNPVRFQSRYNLYLEFAKRMRKEGVNFWTCEIQNGERSFVITEANDPRNLQLRTVDELWHKENAINLMIQRLPRDWEYVAWVDADIMFHRPDWVDETIQQLQVYEVVQMFQAAIDLDPLQNVMQTHQGFMYSYQSGRKWEKGYANWHPGYAWACTRKAYEGFGCLIDGAMLGSGDRHMAMALIGKGAESTDRRLHADYKDMVLEWERRALRTVKKECGYVAGMISHFYHGQKVNRQYGSRWQYLIKHQFSPWRDIFRDSQGLYQLDDDKPEMRDDFKRYARMRNEDDNYVELMP